MKLNQFVKIRRELHQIPELGFQEFKTQEFLLSYLQSLPQERMTIKKWKTGLFVKVQGRNPTKTIGYRTDIDGLPIFEETNLPFASKHTGQMHACGHDFHMSIALGVLSFFTTNEIDDDLVFIFQPAEEGPGGAQLMLESDIMQKWMPNLIIGLHIAPEYPAGAIAIREGLLFANTSELYIDLTGKGGHAAYPHKTNDMVIAACSLVGQLQTIVSRNIDPLDSAVVTIGKMAAGTVQNAIAEKARLEGTIRTLSPEAMNKIKHRIESVVKGIETSFECEAAIDYGAKYYQVNNHPELSKEFIQFLQTKTNAKFIDCKEAMTGEDFGYMLKEIPGFMFWLGVDSPYGLHSSKITPNEEAIPFAVEIITDYLVNKGNH